MSGHSTPGTFRVRLVSGVLKIGALGAVALVFAGAWAGSAAGDGTAGVRPISSETTRPQPQSQRSPDQRRMISPMGSAGGASPGYYQRNMSWTGPDLGYAPVLPPSVPYVVYVEQPYYQRQPEPPPVVVVNNVTVNTPPPVVERVVERIVERESPPARAEEPAAPRAPKPTAPQPVVFAIQPTDALVKLDGRKLGTAAELGSLADPFELKPGVYILQVEHPTYKSQRLVFGVSAELVRVEVDLTSDDASLRARVR